jgi:hypothetical protein
MFEIVITGNFDKIIRNLEALEAKLTTLRAPLEELESTLQSIYDIKFRMYDRHRGRLTDSYRKWKDKKGLPVGVKTGKTRDALTKGGDGNISRVVPGEFGQVFEYGLDLTRFDNRHGYPDSFMKWLRKVGDDLVGLSEEEAEFVLAELAVKIAYVIDKL